jgi:hypothetical protein
VLAQEDGREQLAAAAAWRTSLHRHPPDDLSVVLGLPLSTDFGNARSGIALQSFDDLLCIVLIVSLTLCFYVVTDEAHDRRQLFLALAQA